MMDLPYSCQLSIRQRVSHFTIYENLCLYGETRVKLLELGTSKVRLTMSKVIGNSMSDNIWKINEGAVVMFPNQERHKTLKQEKMTAIGAAGINLDSKKI